MQLVIYTQPSVYRYSNDNVKLQEVMNHIRDVCSKYDIDCKFVAPNWSFGRISGNRYLDIDDGYIDHASELYPLIDELLADDDLLCRYLAGGEVFTGNDNSDDERIHDIITDYEARGYYVYEKGN